MQKELHGNRLTSQQTASRKASLITDEYRSSKPAESTTSRAGKPRTVMVAMIGRPSAGYHALEAIIKESPIIRDVPTIVIDSSQLDAQTPKPRGPSSPDGAPTPHPGRSRRVLSPKQTCPRNVAVQTHRTFHHPPSAHHRPSPRI